MAIPSTSKCMLVLCLLIYTVSLVASDERKDAPNDTCSKDIRALRQELRIQGKRIERFEKEFNFATTSHYSRKPSKRTSLPRQPKSMFNNVNTHLDRITRFKRGLLLSLFIVIEISQTNFKLKKNVRKTNDDWLIFIDFAN